MSGLDQPGNSPRSLRVDERDNVAVVVNRGGLPAGSRFAAGLVLGEAIPEAHKVALADLAKGYAIVRYGVTIGYANRAIARGSWVHEGLMTRAGSAAARAIVRWLRRRPSRCRRSRDTRSRATAILMARWERRTFSASAPRCSAWRRRWSYAVKRIKAEILPRYPNVDDVVAITHPYGCGVAIDAPGAAIPIRTLRNLALHPNFGGEVMVVSLGCEKLQPVRLMPANDSAGAGEEPIGCGAAGRARRASARWWRRSWRWPRRNSKS